MMIWLPRSHHVEVAAIGDPPYPRPVHPPFTHKNLLIEDIRLQANPPFDVPFAKRSTSWSLREEHQKEFQEKPTRKAKLKIKLQFDIKLIV